MKQSTDKTLILKKFQASRGQDFVEALVDEIVDLRNRVAEAEATMKQLDVFAAYMERYTALALTCESLPRMREYSVRADQYFGGKTNFYEVEYTAGGVPFRWTGPDREIVFSIHLDRAVPQELTLKFLVGDDSDQKLPLGLLVDDKPLAYEITDSGPMVLLATLPARSETAQDGLTTVTIVARATLKPSNDDARILGIGFFGMSISPAAEDEPRNK